MPVCSYACSIVPEPTMLVTLKIMESGWRFQNWKYAAIMNLINSHTHLERVPGGKVNILGGHNIGHSKQKSVYVHVPYFELFSR
jgi:hypothetical protein